MKRRGKEGEGEGGAGSCLGPGMFSKSQTGQYLGGNKQPLNSRNWILI